MTALYDTLGATYGATRRADPVIARTLAQLVGLADDAVLLDLACGTGNYTHALAALGGRWHGVDVSERMLAQAAAGSPEIAWQLAAADALPYPDGTFDGAICTLAIHHFPDLRGAFREVFRVLDGGHFVILTAFPDQMESYWLGHYFPAMMERSAP
jgi:ubiquinone/menaquinone biosynthesis C-methylase UbiE